MELEIKDASGKVFQQWPFYDPEQYQSSRNFTVGNLQTLTRTSYNLNQSSLIQTDLQFVQSIKEVSWYHYGVKKHKNAENTEEKLQLLQEQAKMYAQRRTVNNTDILCQNLLKVTYLTYDNVFFFFFIKVLFFNSIIMILGFSVPALVKYGDNDYYSVKKLFQCSASLCSFVDRFSAYNVKDPEQTFPLIEWLGFASLIILQIIFYIAWKINKQVREAVKYEQVVNENVALLKNLPARKFCEREIIEFIQKKFFVESYQGLKQKYKGEQLQSNTKLNIIQSKNKKNIFNIKAVQILYDFRSIKKMINQVKQLAKNCLQLINQKIQDGNQIFVVTDEFLYKDYKASIRNKCMLISEWRKRFLYEEQFRRPLSLDSVFIHFQTSKDKQDFIDYFSKIYPISWIISWGTLEETAQNKQIRQIQEEQNLGLLDKYTLKVGLAPEPENIVWQNVELSFDEWKNENFSFRVLTFVIPLLHFGIMLGLESIKTFFIKQNTNVIWGYIVSVGSVLANGLYWPIMDLTLDKQNHRLVTSKQVEKNYIGFASQSLSIIVAPIITNYVLQGNFYGQKGVIGSAFQYQLTSLITIPFLMLINPAELIQKILSKIDCIRNWRFRRVFEQDQGMRQKASYQFFSIPQFEISSTYAFMMTNFLHVTCFCTALPILILIYAAQLIVLFWVSKVRLVKFCRYPKLIRRWLFGIVFASLVISPLFFIAGFLINLKAFKDARGSIEHDPFALYIYLGIWVLLSILLIFLDKKLQKTQLFSWFIPLDTKAKVQNIQSSRKKAYPSRSSSYLVQNNSIPVLGFEKWIMGSVRNLGGENRLKNLCENEVKKVYTQNNIYFESNSI